MMLLSYCCSGSGRLSCFVQGTRERNLQGETAIFFGKIHTHRCAQIGDDGRWWGKGENVNFPYGLTSHIFTKRKNHFASFSFPMHRICREWRKEKILSLRANHPFTFFPLLLQSFCSLHNTMSNNMAAYDEHQHISIIYIQLVI